MITVRCVCDEPQPYRSVAGTMQCHLCYRTISEAAITVQTTERASIDEYALSLAVTAAGRSEDPYTKVGACAMREDKTIAALGYNGPPPGVDIDWSDRDERRKWVVHAETNAMRYVRPGEVFMVASTLLPCPQCMLILASMGVKRVVYRDTLDPTVYDNDLCLHVAERSGIEVERLSD